MKVRCTFDRMVLVQDLKLNPANRNMHPPEQIRRLAEILEYQGWRYPVKVSKRSGFVTSGHGRVAAAAVNNWKEVPVNFQEYDSEAQEFADLTADNAIALWAELDEKGIGEDFKRFEMELDPNLLGLEDFVPSSLGEEGGDPEDVPDPPKVARTQLGELWILGAHRVLCGDSTSDQDVARLMNGSQADMVFTDPPYNVDYEGSDGQKIKNDNMSDDAFREFCLTVFQNYFISMRDGAPIYVFHADTEGANFRDAFKKAGFHLSSCLVWNKSSLIMGRSDYHWKHEPCLYGWKPGAAHPWYSDRKQTSVYDHAKGSGEDNKMHPTCKPVSLVEYFMTNSSARGGLILDLFLGSGSTLIAAHKNDRKCFGMELDPCYLDVILTRFSKFAGLDPVREDGVKWSALNA